jgi:hypothetical protein
LCLPQRCSSTLFPSEYARAFVIGERATWWEPLNDAIIVFTHLLLKEY